MLLAGFVLATGASGRAAEPEIVGALAIAVEPESASSLGLTANQQRTLQDIVNRYESEALEMAAELRGLTPQQRFARLAEMRRAAEEEGMKHLSVQQRARLEQVRLQRRGLQALVDSALADRLNLNSEQRERIRQLLRQRSEETSGLSEDEADTVRRDYELEIARTLSDEQRAALQQIILGRAVSPSPERPQGLPEPSSVESIAQTQIDQEASDDSLPEPVPGEDEPSAAEPSADELAEDEILEDEAAADEAASEESVQGEMAENGIAETEPDEPAVAEGVISEETGEPAASDEEATGTDEPGNAALAEVESEAENMAEGEGGTEDPVEEAVTPESPRVDAETIGAAGTVPGQSEALLTEAEPRQASSGNAATPPALTGAEAGEEAAASDTPVPTSEAETENGVDRAGTADRGAPLPGPTSPPGLSSPDRPGPGGGFQGFPGGPRPGIGGQPAAPETPGSSSTPQSSDQASMPGEGADVELPGDDVQLRFNFRYQPWDEVLEWFSEQAGLSLVMDAPPPGTFNYVDNRTFTPAEALDLLNSLLLTKGYVLIRRERMLMLVNVNDGIPENLIPTVLPEDLDGRGKYEMVRVLFELQRLTPEAAEVEIRKLLGPQGEVTVLPMARKVLVTDTAGRLQTIRKVLDGIESRKSIAGSEVKTFVLNPNLVDQSMMVLRRLLGIAPEENALEDGTLRFTLDPTGSRLLVTGTPEMLERVGQILQEIDPSQTEGPLAALSATPQLEVFPISSADPDSVLQVLQTLLAGTPDVRLAVDPGTGNLIAWARPSQLAMIRAALNQMQQGSRQMEVIPLRVVDPQLAVMAINKLFGIGSGENGENTDKTLPTVDADLSTRQLLVRGSSAQIQQIRDLLEKMGESPSGQGGQVSAVRTVKMKETTARSLLEQLQKVWPNMRENPLQVVNPSAVVPAMRGSVGGAANPAEETTDSPPRPGVSSQRIELNYSGLSLPQLIGIGRPSNTSQEQESPDDQRGWDGRRWGGRDRGRGPRGGDSGAHQPDSVNPRMYADSESTFWGRVHLVAQNAESAQDAESAQVNVTESAEVETGDSATTLTAPSDQGPASVSEPSPSPGDADVQTVEPTGDAPDGDVETSGRPPIVVTVTPEGLVIASEDREALNQFEDLVRQMVSSGAGETGPQLVFYYLRHARADQVGAVLDQILGGGTLTTGESTGGGSSLVGEMARAALGDLGGGLVGTLLDADTGTVVTPSDTIQITPDMRLNALIVQAYPPDLELIERLLEVLDTPSSPEEVGVEPKTAIIPIQNTSAEEVASILREVYQDRLVQASGGGDRPTPEQIIRLLRDRGGRGGSGASGQSAEEQKQRLALSVDARTNSLIVAAPEPLMQEVRDLIEQLDETAETGTEETTEVITLGNTSPEAIGAAIEAILGEDGVTFGTSGGGNTTRRTTDRNTGRGNVPFFMQRFGGRWGR